MTVWRQAEKHKIPCVCFLNKMDKPAARLYTNILLLISQNLTLKFKASITALANK